MNGFQLFANGVCPSQLLHTTRSVEIVNDPSIRPEVEA